MKTKSKLYEIVCCEFKWNILELKSNLIYSVADVIDERLMHAQMTIGDNEFRIFNIELLLNTINIFLEVELSDSLTVSKIAFSEMIFLHWIL